MKNPTQYLLAAGIAAAMLAGCATPGGGYYGGQDPYGQADPNQKTKQGAAIGAAAGVVAGLLSGNSATQRRQRALVGAGVGGLAGGAIGNYQDRQERDLRQQMAGTGVDIVRDGDNITLNMPDNITFGFDSSELQRQFYPVLDNLSRTLSQYDQTIIEVAGHTDSVGSDSYNQDLSMRRADAVGNYLMSRSLMRDRFIITGAGKTRPIASNETESGRAQNRRVELTLVPLRS